jgi:hypothetical protein
MDHLKELREQAEKLLTGNTREKAQGKGMLKVLDYAYKVELAREMLDSQGYYVDNLWQCADVQGNYQCSDMIAKEVLKDVLEGEYTISQVFEAINEVAKDKGLKQIHDV